MWLKFVLCFRVKLKMNRYQNEFIFIRCPRIFRIMFQDFITANPYRYLLIFCDKSHSIVILLEMKSLLTLKNALKWRMQAVPNKFPTLKYVKMEQMTYFECLIKVKQLIHRYEEIGLNVKGNIMKIYRDIGIKFPKNKNNEKFMYSCSFYARFL